MSQTNFDAQQALKNRIANRIRLGADSFEGRLQQVKANKAGQVIQDASKRPKAYKPSELEVFSSLIGNKFPSDPN